ncbi:MAG: SDR family NAD(P)-dependent oxidoreductase, partial [Dehalococcoidia bacterium]|nr:SDR family NAD(P)-dependent oxidoreductase [Dehalococcoidia bacterium]
MGRLDGKVAIVTGSGRGIGRAVAMTFAREGAKVVIAELDLEPAEEVASDIKSAGGMAIAVSTDVSNRESVKKMVEAALKTFVQIDILVNNAGLFAALKQKPFWEIDSDEWDRVMGVNVKGSFHGARAVFPA